MRNIRYHLNSRPWSRPQLLIIINQYITAMNTCIDNSVDLLAFINSEKKSVCNFNFNKIYSYFSKCFIKTLITVHDKMEETDNNYTYAIASSNILFHVFWVLLNYTNNLTVTIFLSERAILLFTEFILMASNPNINKELYYVPNLTDAMNFSYKKTIGPINLDGLNTKHNFKHNSIILFKLVIQAIYHEIHNNSIIMEKLEPYSLYINSSIVKNYKILNTDVIFQLLFETANTIIYSTNTMEGGLIKLKILLELLYECRFDTIPEILLKIKNYSVIIDNYQFNEAEINIKHPYKKTKLYLLLIN
jgi:hypothetical protein